MNLVKTFGVLQIGSIIGLVLSCFYVGYWSLIGWALWIVSSVLMLLAGTKDPGILPRNVRFAYAEKDILQRNEGWSPL
jgi:hypothetical protein